MRAFSIAVEGWPGASLHSRLGLDQTEEILDAAVKARILTMDADAGHSASLVHIATPNTALLDTTLLHTLLPGRKPSYRVTARHVQRFLFAHSGARRMLHSWPLTRIAERIRCRKENARINPTIDSGTALELNYLYRTIRPFVFSSRAECLLDSLSLVEFLASFELYPAWVFGVRTWPFRAHCWVQSSEAIFNDVPDHAKSYATILSI